MDSVPPHGSSPTGVVIRPAAEADIPAMRRVELDAGESFRSVGLERIADEAPPSDDALRRLIDDGRAWVAERDATVVGYVACSVLDGEGHVDQVSVARAAAGQRIGAALIDHVDDWSAAAGRRWLTLTTFRDVPWNAPYYSRLGFVVLAPDEVGPELARVLDDERAAGLDVVERVAMRREVGRAVRP